METHALAGLGVAIAIALSCAGKTGDDDLGADASADSGAGTGGTGEVGGTGATGAGGSSTGGSGGSSKPCPPDSVVKEFELLYAQSRDCSTDADCEISYPLIAAPCFYYCPVAVAKAKAGSLVGGVKSLSDMCTCETDPPECAFGFVAVCSAGLCELAKPPPDGGS